jgi:hypothetical protein
LFKSPWGGCATWISTAAVVLSIWRPIQYRAIWAMWLYIGWAFIYLTGGTVCLELEVVGPLGLAGAALSALAPWRWGPPSRALLTSQRSWGWRGLQGWPSARLNGVGRWLLRLGHTIDGVGRRWPPVVTWWGLVLVAVVGGWLARM